MERESGEVAFPPAPTIFYLQFFQYWIVPWPSTCIYICAHSAHLFILLNTLSHTLSFYFSISLLLSISLSNFYVQKKEFPFWTKLKIYPPVVLGILFITLSISLPLTLKAPFWFICFHRVLSALEKYLNEVWQHTYRRSSEKVGQTNNNTCRVSAIITE